MNAIPKRGTLDLEQPIYDRIFAAIAERRLPAGTQMIEETLAAAFGVSRARIRKVLTRLSADRLVDLKPNRGAFVALPSSAEVHQVLDARRMLEIDICHQVIARHGSEDRRIWAEQVRRGRLHMGGGAQTGRFHLLLADLTGNPIIVEFLTGLLRRSALIIATFQRPQQRIDAALEHERLLDLLVKGDAAAMAQETERQLTRLADQLEFDVTVDPRVDLMRLFRRI